MKEPAESSNGSLSQMGLTRDRLSIPAPDSDHGFFTYYPGGSLAIVSAPRGDAYAAYKDGKSKRGDITSFSNRSRNRLIRRLSTIHRRAEARAITLTLEKNVKDEQEAKQYLHAFFERMRINYPFVGAIWKLEYQDRGAVHFHLLTWGGWICKDWLAENWDRIADQNHTRSHSPSTKIEYVGSVRNSGLYLSKYVCKGEFTIDGRNCGRIWGIHRKCNVPFVSPVTCRICSAGARAILAEWTERFDLPYRLNTVHIFLNSNSSEQLENIMRHAP